MNCNDRSDDGGLHQKTFPDEQGGQCDEQFCQIAQRGIEQTANHIAGFGSHRFGCATEQSRQGHDGGDREQKQKGMRFRIENLCEENHRYQDQQSQQGIVTDLFKQIFHFATKSNA
jgi:hypothetical protein